MTAENEEIVTKPRRKPFPGAKPISILLSVVLTVLIIAAGLLGVVRSTLSDEGIRRILTSENIFGILRAMKGGDSEAELLPDPGHGDIYVAAAMPVIPDDVYDVVEGLTSGDYERAAEMICDIIGDDVLEKCDLDREAVAKIVEKSTVDEFVADRLANTARNFIESGEIGGIDSKMVVDLLRENRSVIKEVTGRDITDEQFAEIEQKVVEADIKVEFTADEVKESIGFDPTVFAAFISPMPYISAAAACAVVALIIFVMNKFLVGRTLSYVSVCAVVAGVFMVICAAAIYALSSSVLGGALAGMAGALNVPFVIRAASYICVGVATLIASIPLKKKNI